jgi:hypothetical protein
MWNWLELVALVVALLSGPLSIVRDLILAYRPEQTKSERRSTSWAWVRIAFVISAFVAWYGVHSQLTATKEQLNDVQGQLKAIGLSKDFPQLRATIDNIAVARDADSTDSLILVVFMTIDNSGAPTPVDGYSLLLRLARFQRQYPRQCWFSTNHRFIKRVFSLRQMNG